MSKSSPCRRTFPLTVAVKIINGYIVVTSPDFWIHITAAKMTELKEASLDQTLRNIGLSVVKGLTQVQECIKQDIPTQPQGGLLTVGVVATKLGVTPQTIRRLVGSGELLGIITDGGHRRIYQASLDEYLARKP
jgi:excisionase family DNA binding protein